MSTILAKNNVPVQPSALDLDKLKITLVKETNVENDDKEGYAMIDFLLKEALIAVFHNQYKYSKVLMLISPASPADSRVYIFEDNEYKLVEQEDDANS